MIDVIVSWDFAIFIAGLGVVVLLWMVCASGAERTAVSCECGRNTLRKARFMDPVDADLARQSLTAQCDHCVKLTAKRMIDGRKRRIVKTKMQWGGHSYNKHHELGAPEPSPTLEITA